MHPNKPSAYNNDYLTLASAVDVVEDALHQLALDASGMSRLAVASTLDHGAAAWKLELAYQITRRGLPVKTLYSDDSLRRVDLLVRGEAFEFRSTFSTYAVTKTAEQNRQWLRHDVQKILDSGEPGCIVLTIATFLDGTDARYDVLRGSTDLQQPEVREVALKRFRAVVLEMTGISARHVHVGVARLPANRGTVHLDVLLAVVRRGFEAPDEAKQKLLG
ncbi:hypothetical protein [Rhodococcoides corynebacterioides]|uniref:hypothetical protein n=1 Tax=Rhodococcoides corynebacterioides TaxID=53972 RepID=UPI001C9AADAE|nr:hypothetical protein [Rhodococcus corynebacterioides]MBY6363260.1 hypothetical protein [Rhodococcus corynebacterioides]